MTVMISGSDQPGVDQTGSDQTGSDQTGESGTTSGEALDGALQGADPAAGLRGVVALRALADQLEFLHVQRARERDWSWQEIAAALGISRQAVHKKYGRRF
jgi:hypothetical protein